jgi:hypothetical protein
MPKINKLPITIKYLAVVPVIMYSFFLSGEKIALADGYAGEKIIYTLSPLGRAEYNDLGEVEIDGKRLNRVTFRTQIMGFDDTETIYSDTQNHLPVKVERDISKWSRKEHLIEQYDQTNFELTIDKFKKKKKVKHYSFKKDGLIQNAILLPFYLRGVNDLNIGWEIKVRVPDEFTIRLESIEQIEVPAGKFMAYHFTSIPEKIEIWISKDDLRLPIKIKGPGDIKYTMTMKKHFLPQAGTKGLK